VIASEKRSSAGLAAYRTMLDQSGERIAELSLRCNDLTAQLSATDSISRSNGFGDNDNTIDDDDDDNGHPHNHRLRAPSGVASAAPQNVVLSELLNDVKRLQAKADSLQREYNKAVEGERTAREQAAHDASVAASKLREAFSTVQCSRDAATALRDELAACEARLVNANARADDVTARLKSLENETAKMAVELANATDAARSKVVAITSLS
jgi:hypothetical protein